MFIWLNIIISSIVVFTLTYIYPGAHVDSFYIAIIVAVILALLNSAIWPVLEFFNLPPDVLNIWLISLVINFITVLLVAKYMPGFTLKGYSVVFIFSLLMSLCSAALSLKPGNKIFRP